MKQKVTTSDNLSFEFSNDSNDKAITPTKKISKPGQAKLKKGSDHIGPFRLNDVHLCDAIASMAQLPDACVDLAVIDPPYNVSQGGEWKWDNSKVLPGMGGNWNKVIEEWDTFELKDYFDFTLAWAT